MIPSLTERAVTLSQSPELSVVIKATVLIAMGLLAARLAVRARASVRHVLLAATFAAVLALPLAATLVPAIAIGVRLPPVSPTAASGANASVSAADLADASATAQTPGRGEAADSRAVPPRAVPTWSWTMLVRAAWGVGVGFLLTALALVLRRLAWLRRTGLPWPEMRDAVQSLAADAGLERRVDLVLHEEASSPLTFGTRRPIIVLPPDARAWPVADLRRALVHELEHVRRGDWAVQTLARAVCAAWWFHPLVWVVWRRLSLDAERACDDAVVAKEERMEYAEQLVSLAERLTAARAQPTLGMANRSDLSARVSSLLDARQRRGRAGAGASLAAIAAAVFLVMTIAPLRAVARPADVPPEPAAGVAREQGQGHGRVQRALDRELYEASRAGDVESINDLLQAGAGVNAVLYGDGSPLIAAARSGRAEVARLLLDKGADPNLGVKGDGSPLIAAAVGGRVEMATLLIERGAEIDMVVEGDENPLIQGAAGGHLAMVQLLVARGADVNARVRVTNRQGEEEWRSPLSQARRNGRTRVAQFLVESGAHE